MKSPWDLIPKMTDAQSFKHLASLATSVVQEVLGPSPQAAKEAEDEAEYQRRLWHWQNAQEAGNPYDEPPPVRHHAPPVDLDAWLRRKITERLLSRIDDVLMDLIGIESSFGSFRLKSSQGFTGTRLTERAKAIATDLADKWVNENHNKFVLPELKFEEISRHYKWELEKATKAAIEARIAVIAKERAEHVRTEVLEAAIDQAMFDSYPILRRMEAASRLGAKGDAA